MHIIQNKKKNIFYIIIIITLTALLLTGVAYVLDCNNVIDLGFSQQREESPENTVNYEEPEDEQKKEGERIKDEFDKNHYNEENGDGGLVGVGEKVNVNITYISQDSDIVSVRSTVQTLVAGSCEFLVSQNGAIVYESKAETMAQGSYSVCKGFDIEIARLKPGVANFKITYRNGSAFGYGQKDYVVK